MMTPHRPAVALQGTPMIELSRLAISPAGEVLS
jgi:hypothetical protein